MLYGSGPGRLRGETVMGADAYLRDMMRDHSRCMWHCFYQPNLQENGDQVVKLEDERWGCVDIGCRQAWGGTKTRPVDFPEDKTKKWLFRGSRVKCRLAISKRRKLKWKGGAGGETNLQGKLLRYTVWKTDRFFLFFIYVDHFDLNSNISCS